MAEQKAEFLAQQLAQYQRSAEELRPPAPPLDPVGDPEGFARAMMQENAALRSNLQSISANLPAHITEHLVREKHGDAAVDEAVAEAHKAGLGTHFMKQRNPYKALMEWKTNQTIAQQVGPDLKAWEAKKEQEIEARIMARMNPVKPGAPQNLPPSLSNATNANNSVPVVKESSDFFKEMFAKPRT